MGLVRAGLRELAAAALKNTTLAGDRVFTARSWPITPLELPALSLQTPDDSAENLATGSAFFRRVATLAIRGRVAGETPAKAELLAEDLANQIEWALLTDLTFMNSVESINGFQSAITISSETEDHIGELRMLMSIQYPQEFDPSGRPLREVDGTIQTNGNDDFAAFAVKLK